MARQLDSFFSAVGSARQFDPVRFLRLASQPTAIRVKLEHNRRKAEKLKKQFVEFFG